MTRGRRLRPALLAGLAASVLVGSGAAPAATAGPSKVSPKDVIVFNGEGNNLNAYKAEPPFTKQNVIRNHKDDPKHGLDINAQICFFPDGSNRFVAGEDTGQPNPPQGWGILQLRGTQVGQLSAKQVGKLTATYQPSTDNAENYGCGFLSDGRIVTTDIGNQSSGPGNGQLIVWFPPFNSTNVRYCKIDVGIATAGAIFVDKQDRVYVPSARPPEPGVYRYSGPFPTSDDATGGCAGQGHDRRADGHVGEQGALHQAGERAGFADRDRAGPEQRFLRVERDHRSGQRVRRQRRLRPHRARAAAERDPR
jgi:hypothetical protein